MRPKLPLALIAVALLMMLALPSASAQSLYIYAPQTQHSIVGDFAFYWQNHGAWWAFGFPLTEEFDETLGGQTMRVQYFERAILEYHPENKGTEFAIMPRRIGAAELDRNYPNNSNPAIAPVAPKYPTSSPSGPARPSSTRVPPTATNVPTEAPAAPSAPTDVSTSAPVVIPTNQPTNTLTPTATPQATQTPRPEPTQDTHQKFTGGAQQTTQRFYLNAGLTILNFTHQGQGNFIVELLSADGTFSDLLVNEIGNFDGVRAVGAENAEDYILDITASGSWTISIDQPDPASASITAPQSFNGAGTSVSPLMRLTAGTATFQLTHDGTSNFIVSLLNGLGEQEELLVNEIGSFSGSKAVRIDSTGTYVLDIVADGVWSISVQQ